MLGIYLCKNIPNISLTNKYHFLKFKWIKIMFPISHKYIEVLGGDVRVTVINPVPSISDLSMISPKYLSNLNAFDPKCIENGFFNDFVFDY